MIAVSVQREDFDPGREQAALEASGGGAVASFTGLVRGDDGLVELHLDHYPDMTQARLEKLGREAVARWGLMSVRIIHRVGRSEEHTSELQSLMRISYAVFCLKKKKKTHNIAIQNALPQQ